MHGSNRGNLRCFNCEDVIDGNAEVFCDDDGYGVAAFCQECLNMGESDEDDIFLYDPDAVLLALSWWTLRPEYAAARGIGGTTANPVVLV
jgi:hypothetical protein